MKPIHEQHQFDFKEGSIDLQFNLDYDGNEVTVSTIQVHGNFDTEIKTHSPELLYDNDNSKWRLAHYYHKATENNSSTMVREWIIGPYSDTIVAYILQKKEESKPRFGNS